MQILLEERVRGRGQSGSQPVARITALKCVDPALPACEITPQAVTMRLSRRLRDLIGPGRRWSYVEISARTLIDVRSLKAYVSGQACPNLAKYKRLVVVMGPEVAMDLNRMLGWEPRAGREPPEALDLHGLEAALRQADQALRLVLGNRQGDVAVSRSGTGGRPGEAAAGSEIETLAPFRRALPANAITPQAIAARLSFRLKRMLQADREWTIGRLSQATGISRAVIEAYVAGTACPNLARYFRLERVLGQELGIEFALMLGWEPRYRPDRSLSHALLNDLRSRIRGCLDAVDRIAGRGGAGQNEGSAPSDSAIAGLSVRRLRR